MIHRFVRLWSTRSCLFDEVVVVTDQVPFLLIGVTAVPRFLVEPKAQVLDQYVDVLEARQIDVRVGGRAGIETVVAQFDPGQMACLRADLHGDAADFLGPPMGAKTGSDRPDCPIQFEKSLRVNVEREWETAALNQIECVAAQVSEIVQMQPKNTKDEVRVEE